MEQQETLVTKHSLYMREWRKTHPLTAKQRAHEKTRSIARQAVRQGKIERKPCEVCGARAEMHHDDYSKPLVVRWLCRKHHIEVHHPYPRTKRVSKRQILKGREALTLQIRSEQKRQLKEIKEHHRSSSNPNASMTLVLEQLIAKEHKRLKL